MPKIDDQTEISGTPRALNQQHLENLRKIRKFLTNFWRFYCFFRYLRGARGGRNFWPIDDFWPMMSYDCWYTIICIYDTHIWKYDKKPQKWRKNWVFWSKIRSKWHIKIPSDDMLHHKKSWKNDFTMIVLCCGIFEYHRPKIDDQSEISVTLRALNRQHLLKLWKIIKKTVKYL